MKRGVVGVGSFMCYEGVEGGKYEREKIGRKHRRKKGCVKISVEIWVGVDLYGKTEG